MRWRRWSFAHGSVSKLDDWVMNGKAPDQMLAEHVAGIRRTGRGRCVRIRRWRSTRGRAASTTRRTSSARRRNRAPSQSEVDRAGVRGAPTGVGHALRIGAEHHLDCRFIFETLGKIAGVGRGYGQETKNGVDIAIVRDTENAALGAEDQRSRLEFPDQKGAALDGGFEPLLLVVRNAAVENELECQALLAGELADLQLTGSCGAFPIEMAGAFRGDVGRMR